MKIFTIVYLSFVTLFQVGFLALFAATPENYEWQTIDTVSLLITIASIAVQWVLFAFGSIKNNQAFYILSLLPAISLLFLVLEAQ